MPLPIKLPPGVVLTDSPNATEGRWTGGNLMRFIGRYPEKWGGWRRQISSPTDGPPRGATAWASISGNYNIGVGTYRRAYALTGGDTLLDITPIRATGTLANDPFAVTIGSAVVLVTHVAHGLAQGAVVSYSGATAGGGVTIDGEYIVTEITTVDTYKVTHTSAATSTDSTTGGAAVAYVYFINPGNESPTVGTGWSTGVWGVGTGGWSAPTTGGDPEDMRHWSLQSYGHNLLGVPFGGTLYQWIQGTDNEFQEITQAPDYIRSMVVTAERFVLALGNDAGGTVDPMRIDWPDQDDITDWTPTDVNTANTRRLQYGSKIISGTTLTNKETLIWTDAGLYVFQYDGSEFVYNDRLVGKNCGLVGPISFCEMNGIAYWMSGYGFHYYNGAVQDIPNQDDILTFIQSDINVEMIAKTYCQANAKNGTIMFFYVSMDSLDGEPDKCLEVNASNWAWSPVHSLSRCSGTLVDPASASLVMFDPDGYSFRHEVGVDASAQDGSLEPMDASISFEAFSLTSGETNIDIMGFVPDFERQTGTVEVTLSTKDRPNSASDFDSQTLFIEEGDGIADARVSGRYLGALIRTNELSADLRLGICQYEVQDAGQRR